MDKQLIDLTYKSIYFQRDQFEYFREPAIWKFWYESFNENFSKIAMFDGVPIATLGILVRTGKINTKKIKIGSIVDINILPSFIKNHDTIFGMLYKEIEKKAKALNIDLLVGWEFAKKMNQHKQFYQKEKFHLVKQFDWVVGGTNPFNTYPSIFWKFLFKLSGFYSRFTEKKMPKSENSIIIKTIEDKEIPSVVNLLNAQKNNCAQNYNSQTFKQELKKESIKGISAYQNGKLVGVLTYFLSAWSGDMYGKPGYDKNSSFFFSYAIDDFFMLKEYQNTPFPTQLILHLTHTLLNGKFTKDNMFTVSLLDGKDTWKQNALKNAGFYAPSYDQGVLFFKKLTKKIKIDKFNSWFQSCRHVVTPVKINKKIHYLVRGVD